MNISNKFKIVIVEDEKILRVSLTDDLRDAGFAVVSFENPVTALEHIRKEPSDVVLTDIRMPKMSGLEMLSRIKEIHPSTIVIVMTAYGSISSAVEAMKKGAYDYINKPFHIDELLLLLDRIKEFKSIKQENIKLKSEISAQYGLDAYIGESDEVKRIRNMVSAVADNTTTILITGETGTGKELLTNIIHYNSSRRDKQFIKVSCAILSREIFESELFGHEKGAFTGAAKDRSGRFELANGGTIYLDDVDDIPLDLQVKLLRVLQEQEFERVGGNDTIKVDVRVIASTKADIRKLVKDGKFREDLFYRLNVFPIHLAPLRERRSDIPILIEHFLKILAPAKILEVVPDALCCLQEYDWHGNVRELKNIVERLILLAKGDEIGTSLIPSEIFQQALDLPDISIGQQSLDEILAGFEEKLLVQALSRTHGNKARAAELLKIPPSTLRSKINKYCISSDDDS